MANIDKDFEFCIICRHVIGCKSVIAMTGCSSLLSWLKIILVFFSGISPLHHYMYIGVPSKETLGGKKVSMLAHTYPHKPLRKMKVTMCNHQADSPLYVWPDI